MIAHGTAALAEYSFGGQNYRELALKILPSLDPTVPLSYVEQSLIIAQALIERDRMIFLLVTDKIASQMTRTAALEELRRTWRQRYGNSGVNFAPNSKNHEFGDIEIAALFDRWNSPSQQKVTQVQQNLDSTVEEMNEVLEQAFLRGNEIDALTMAADEISHSATEWRREVNHYRCHACISKWKWYILGISIIIVIIFLIVWTACGVHFEHC
jgi:hypothetical protein